MDVTQELNSVERIVSMGALDARALQLTRECPAPIEEVWEVLTDPDRIPTWLAAVAGDLKVGGRYQLEDNAGGEILACERPHRLSVTWEYGVETTRVDIRLTDLQAGKESGSRTRLELTHTGSHDRAKWQTYGPGAVGIGWEMALLAMSAQFRTIDVSLADWFAGAEATAFISGSGAAWGDAAAAAGEDADQAREAAARCVAAYTTPPPSQD